MHKALVKYFNSGLNLKNDSFLRRTLARNVRMASNANNSSRTIFHKYKPIEDAPPGLFKGASDRFNGVTIDSEEEFAQDEDFMDKLEKSLSFWAHSKRRTIWFKIHKDHTSWVPYLAEKGFDFHHAKRGFVVMYKWLPTDEIVNIPEYAHTMVGVGGLVINDEHEVLVVNDKNAIIPGSFKLPGGYVEPRENLIDAAIREVKEETGVETKFKSVISLRHSHGGMFDCTDLYIVVALTPLTRELIRCEREILKVEWIPIEKYLNHPNIHETNRRFVKTFLEHQRLGITIDCEDKVHQILNKSYQLYLVKSETE